MEKINIVEIARDPQVINALSNFKTALNELFIQPPIQEVINKTSREAARQFNLDEAELAFFLSDKLPAYFPSIDTADENWPVSLIRWSSTVATNRCRNIWKRKNTTEKNYEAHVNHENSSGKRNSQRIFISATPEDELSIAEQEPLWAIGTDDIHSRVRRVILEDALIADLWSKGFSPKRIAEHLNKPAKTVYGKLVKIHKAVILEIGIVETPRNHSLIKPGLRELYGSSLRGLIF